MTEPQLPTLSGPEVLPQDGSAPESLIILIHGYGANGDDLIGLAPALQPVLPRTAFVSPNAPEPVPGAPMGRQWFPISQLSPNERDHGSERAAPVLNAFIDQQLEKFSLAPNRLVLLGFSQGTMMSLQVGLRRPEPIAGILGYSGSLPNGDKLAAEITQKPPICLVHGDMDTVLPVGLLSEAVGGLQAAGLTVTHHISRGVAHGIAPDGLQVGAQFLAEVLA